MNAKYRKLDTTNLYQIISYFIYKYLDYEEVSRGGATLIQNSSQKILFPKRANFIYVDSNNKRK